MVLLDLYCCGFAAMYLMGCVWGLGACDVLVAASLWFIILPLAAVIKLRGKKP